MSRPNGKAMRFYATTVESPTLVASTKRIVETNRCTPPLQSGPIILFLDAVNKVRKEIVLPNSSIADIVIQTHGKICATGVQIKGLYAIESSFTREFMSIEISYLNGCYI